jgi:hypothetical protein
MQTASQQIQVAPMKFVRRSENFAALCFECEKF